MRVKIKVGQVWRYDFNPTRYRIIKAATLWDDYNLAHYIGSDGFEDSKESLFGRVGSDGLTELISWKLENQEEVIGYPLDPTLPILQAGHLQDRMRRRGKC